METALHIVIGTMSVCILVGIPCIIWLIKDNKRREQQEQETARPTAVAQ
jgi:hypothetical protein